ncbi:Vps5 C terminal like-domain-containing protein [Infundibulicybe gibba]|nr:Vps5 C terminal like-domain-containing protein [Infundibulicybe gibba]
MPPSNPTSQDHSLLIGSSSDSSFVSTSRVEAALRKFSKQAMNFEHKMKDLESLFATGLHDFRNINELMEAAALGVEADTKRAHRALHSQIPYINSELDGSMRELENLAETLPTIRSQVADIRKVYKSGRNKDMDGFDDLLAPSRQLLEDNPFADPFAKRSNSPDPWATPFAANQPESSFEETTSTTPTIDQPSTTEHSESSSTAEGSSHGTPPPSTDPLESASYGDDDDNKPLGTFATSPGFRESVPANFSEIATIRPTEIEEPARSALEPYQSPIPPAQGITTASPPPQTRQSPQGDTGLGSPTFSKPDVSLLWNTPNLLDLITDQAQATWTGGRAASRFPTEDDSDDDVPIAQSVKLANNGDDTKQKSSHSPSSSRNDNTPRATFSISVEDPQKVGDPIRSFTMYTVHTRTNSPLYQKSAFSVLRRYSDFLWLYETLSINNPGVVVPPVPEKNPFGRFDDQFVRQRRSALEKCIQKIANHPILGKDTDLRLFLESDTFSLDIKHRKAEIAHERGGLMASIGQSIAGPRFHETDEWFDRQKVYLDSLESQLRGLVKSIDLVAKHRGDLAVATGEFAQTVGDLSASDVGKQLSYSLSGLSDVTRKAQDLQNTQSEQDVVTLMSTVDEYARLINSVRLAFNSRIRTYHAWRAAEADLQRVKQTHEKNRAQGRVPADRPGHAVSQIAEAERRSLEAKHEFDHVSKLIKSELARFENERVEDFKNSLQAFLEGMITRQRELILTWENYQQQLLTRVGGGRNVPGDTATTS